MLAKISVLFSQAFGGFACMALIFVNVTPPPPPPPPPPPYPFSFRVGMQASYDKSRANGATPRQATVVQSVGLQPGANLAFIKGYFVLHMGEQNLTGRCVYVYMHVCIWYQQTSQLSLFHSEF